MNRTVATCQPISAIVFEMATDAKKFDEATSNRTVAILRAIYASFMFLNVFAGLLCPIFIYYDRQI